VSKSKKKVLLIKVTLARFKKIEEERAKVNESFKAVLSRLRLEAK